MAIADILAVEGKDDLTGLTSLAEGADQIFGFAVLAAGGFLHAIIPSESYERSFVSPPSRDAYTALRALAGATTILPFSTPNEDAYLAAGHDVADRCEILIAVWDGKQAAGKGGTGDVVAYARARGRDIRIVWPDGASRR
ncbi:hypothetical protein [Geodermatophilus nigrescens]|uniref:hypothetical protein n=1 Tax=Geodermatophilus nigrescens TaxID=1070870 RepID=UPI001C31526A|nr:hypothetical protein [Geodermatophilus nigrescens]